MKVDEVNINGNKFIGVEVNPVRQKGKIFYFGRVPARFFLDSYTVIPAEYDVGKATSLAEAYRDDKEYAEFRLDIERKESEIDTKSFERKLDRARVKEITGFLNTDEYALFPNSVIVMCDLINDNVDVPPGTKITDIAGLIGEGKENLAFLQETKEADGQTMLYIPENRNALLIIDGQHRIKGLENADEEVIDNYDILVSFIVGFDRAVVAKLFYTINYTQKPVNKSLLYHLMGEFSHKLDEHTFLHEAVRVLNELSESPLYKRIKMLGTLDYSAPYEIREKMTISQAFLIDYLIRSIDADAKLGLYPPIFLPYYEKEEKQVEIIRFLMNYFGAIKDLNKDDWDNPRQSIICKTIGIGAFIRVMYLFFVKMFIEEGFDRDISKIANVQVNDIMGKMDGSQKIDFSTDGPYGKAASGGSLNKLKEEIVEKIDYFGGLSYEDFIRDYRARYLRPFRALLSR